MEISKIFRPENRKKILLVAGIAAMVLIGLSVLIPSNKDTPQTAAAENADEETARYEEKLRERVLAIVSQIDGVGDAHVSLTLDSGIEYVYAKEEKQDTDMQDDTTGGTTTRASSEEKLIIVEDENGRKTALIRKTLLPAVRGVVIVGDGGGDPLVVSAVTEAVKTALGINTSQVYVTKRAAGSAAVNQGSASE